MAYKNLPAEEMVDLTGTLVDKTTDAHAALMANAELSASMPRILGAHTGLSTILQPAPTPRLAEIGKQQAQLDVRHDAIIRAVIGFCLSTADLIGGDEGAAFITLSEYLLPDGLESQLKSYRAEAGQAEQLADRMTAAIRQQTDEIMVGQGKNAKPLTAYVDELIDLGKQLGDLEDERGRLEDEGTGSSERKHAINHWIRVINLLTATAALIDLDPAIDTLIFGPFRSAEKKADERAREAIAREKAAKSKAAKEAAAKEAAKAKEAAAKETAVKAAPGDGKAGGGGA